MSVLLSNSGETLMGLSGGGEVNGYEGGTNDLNIGNGGTVYGNQGTEIEAD